MTKTYSELRQEALFRAARGLHKIATEILTDTLRDEHASAQTLDWAKSAAAATMKTANEIEGRGHEQCIASARAETTLYKSKRAYSDAVDQHIRRVQKVVSA